MSVLTDIAAGMWIFFTGAAAARIAFAPRRKTIFNIDLNPSKSMGIDTKDKTND